MDMLKEARMADETHFETKVMLQIRWLGKFKCNKPQFLSPFITWYLVKENATSRSISTAKGNT